MRPTLARPWINAFRPKDLSAPWWTASHRELGANIFRAPVAAHPVIVRQTIHRLPELGIPQVCFVGFSNVGKSSLVNALVYGKEIARPSLFPGRTRHLFVFDLGRELSLVDLPGYGFAKVKPELQQDWELLVRAYFEHSKSLRRVICLVDAAKGINKEDTRLWDAVMAAGRRLMVVLTKVDLCHHEDLHRNVAEVIAALQPLDRDLVWPFVHSVSAEHDLGLRELRASLASESATGLMMERAAAQAAAREARRGGPGISSDTAAAAMEADAAEVDSGFSGIFSSLGGGPRGRRSSAGGRPKLQAHLGAAPPRDPPPRRLSAVEKLSGRRER